MTMPMPQPKGWDYWFVQCSDQEKEQILTEHAKKTVTLFKQLRDLLREQIMGRADPPVARLVNHIERLPERWEMYRQLLPQEYDRDQKDFAQLVERVRTDRAFAEAVAEERARREQERIAQTIARQGAPA